MALQFDLVIKSFLHKGLKELYQTGKSASVPSPLVERCKLRLAALDRATMLSDVNLPGFNFHPLKGFKPVRYSIHVNGPWAITFGWQAPDVYRVDLEQYH
jgi:toxin HigB-1